MNKIVTLNALRGNSYSLFRKIPLMINMGVCAFCLVPAMVFAENTHEVTVLNAQQQTRKAVGVVTDKTGEAIIGANVIVKGTTNGTITDMDGRFELDVPNNATLQVSYIGFNTQEIVFTGQPSIEVQLVDDTQALDEVVVTALGIKREKKALGYSMSELKGESLTQTRDANVANALAGKVAGLQIKQNGTGVGGSSRIVIRGNNSITGNNQPLIVVDGVPIDNFSGGTDDYWGNGNVDKGSGISDISPDDIESMSVLKGPAAAALYGSRAGNGVVMITTKKGSQNKGWGVSINSNFTAENPMQTPKFQDVYGQGIDGAFDNNKATSWGAAMDGSSKDMAMGSYQYAARDNDLYKDFLRTGTTWTNSVDLSKSSEDITFRAGVTRLDNKGVVPNSGMDRTSINLRSTAKLSKWLSADVKVNYVSQHTNNRVKLAGDPDNIFLNYLSMPRSVGFSDYDAYKDNDWKRADGKPAGYLIDTGANANNPYWSAYRNTNKDKKDRFIGFAALDFTFTDWLSLKLRSGMDNYTIQYETIRATGNPYWENNGSMTANMEKFTEINSDFLLTAKGNWDRFGIVGTVGGNMMYRNSTWYKESSGEFVIPDFHAIANGKTHGGEYTRNRKQINSLYATASLSWDDYLYLDLTARNDWSSTLPKDNDSYFYPSVGVSWIFTQMLNKMGHNTGILSFGKIRASWAQVGNDTDAYMLRDYYNISYDIKGGIFNASNEDWMANPNLKNETINSWELGLELKAFENRVGVDVAYYKKNAKDQILKIDVPSATGFKKKMINAGNIENKGMEFSLGYNKSWGDFSWNSNLTFSFNKNKIVELLDDAVDDEGNHYSLSEIDKGGIGSAKVILRKGGSMGDMYVTNRLKRDNEGNVYIDKASQNVKKEDIKNSDEFIHIGSVLPKSNLGFRNDFSYKGISLGFMLAARFGGIVISPTQAVMDQFGVSNVTALARDNEGVPVNNGKVDPQTYYTEVGGISGLMSNYVYSATNVRLQELSVGYSLPAKWFNNKCNLSLSITGHNLWMIYNKAPFDPEATASTGTYYQGVDYFMQPSLRSWGFNVKIQF